MNCTVSHETSTSGDANYSLTMSTPKAVPAYTHCSCSFLSGGAPFTTNLSKVFDSGGWCSGSFDKATGCKKSSDYSYDCMCGCDGAPTPGGICNFNWNATVFADAAADVGCHCKCN